MPRAKFLYQRNRLFTTLDEPYPDQGVRFLAKREVIKDGVKFWEGYVEMHTKRSNAQVKRALVIKDAHLRDRGMARDMVCAYLQATQWCRACESWSCLRPNVAPHRLEPTGYVADSYEATPGWELGGPGRHDRTSLPDCNPVELLSDEEADEDSTDDEQGTLGASQLVQLLDDDGQTQESSQKPATTRQVSANPLRSTDAFKLDKVAPPEGRRRNGLV